MIDIDMIVDWRTLERALNTLPNAMAKGVLKTAMRKALKPVLAGAESNAPVREGKFKKSFRITPTLSRSQRKDRQVAPGAVVMSVGSTDPKAHLIEFGTANMSAQATLRPAWDMDKKQVLNTFAREIGKSLERTAKRLARQAAAGKLSKKGARALGV